MSLMLHIWLRSTNCTKPLSRASHNSLIALAKQILSNCVVSLIWLSILLNILERSLNQSSKLYNLIFIHKIPNIFTNSGVTIRHGMSNNSPK